VRHSNISIVPCRENVSLLYFSRLQDARTIRKILSIDDRTVLAFAGLNADARVLIQHLRSESLSYRYSMDHTPTVDWIARHLASIQQYFTQRAGVRPFGIATLIAGVGPDGPAPVLYQTDPAGTQSKWKAQVIGGRNAKSLREYLEKQYTANMEEATVLKMAVSALLEVVDSGAQTMEICVVRLGGKREMLTEAAIEAIVQQIETEQQEQSAGAVPAAPAIAASS
jgi:20S proteasome subunit alpha 4